MPLSPDDLASDAARTIAIQMLQERGRGAAGIGCGGWDRHLCRVGRLLGSEPIGIQQGYPAVSEIACVAGYHREVM
jgi:hypothetical protein